MLFNSIHFLIFFPIIVVLYFLISQKYRWILLLLSSYYFYMSWSPKYIFIIIISTLIDYFSSIQIYKAKSDKLKKTFLTLSLISNLGILFIFKYFNFFNENIIKFLEKVSIHLDPMTIKVLLPVGISFYTFQTLSYTIDVYKGKIKPQKHLGIFAVYVSFFPQLVAGPIERAKSLMPQFFEKHNFEYKRTVDGLKLMLWGYFKKVVIADRLAMIVDSIYNNPTNFSGLYFVVATLFFSFQIYCDFSGYSDIAIGSAKILGFDLMNNFNRPYFSRSISEFWRRWHISLSTWFKDYVYIPLGGNRVSLSRQSLNLFLVFSISGLWHGANWTFIIWGMLNGIYLILENILKPIIKSLFKFESLFFTKSIYLLEIILTFILINISWIFFRANSLTDALYILKNLFINLNQGFSVSKISNVDVVSLSIVMVSLVIMEMEHIIQEFFNENSLLNSKYIFLRWTVYIFIIFSILLFGAFDEMDFIYFQF